MADSVALPELAIDAPASDLARHSALVRRTHWIHTAAVSALIVSGGAILIAHPRLYWGETGGAGGPSLVDLPLPFVFGPSGWGRSLHFLAAWIAVLNGLLYVVFGLVDRHFRRRLLPGRSELSTRSIRQVLDDHVHLRRLRADGAIRYNLLQQLAYLVVIFVLFPLIILTGFAMSPALTSVAPMLVTVWGGQQSARTMHFVFTCALVLFVVAHVLMIALTGFRERMRAMITGDHARTAP
jgi:thiosulfate reductase cytochrome b subunit